MKVQLFVPPGGYFAERWSKGSTMPPLGILSIAAVLEKEGVPVEVVPADVLGMGWKDIAAAIRRFEPDIVGVTSTTENRFQSFDLVRLAKRTRPSALTVMGGPHASMAAEDALGRVPELDIAVRGEGERTLLELCRVLEGNLDPARAAAVPGCVARREGRVVAAPPRAPVEDLDALPFPAFHLVPFEKYNFVIDVPGRGLLPAVNVMTSRGCPFNCNFCATPINWGRHVRMRSPESVVAEIEALVGRYGSKVVFFYDDTFNANPKRVERICDLLVERKLDVVWRCEARLDLIDKPLLAKMRAAGLFHISFGLEAGSERVRNEVVGKKIDIADFHNLVRWCEELGIIPNAFFIFSHPTETWEEAQETIRIVEAYKDRVEATVAILHVYPGTPLEAIAKEIGVLPKDFSWARRHDRRIVTLPAAQGDVPLFLDKLTWAQVSELLFRWSLGGGRISIARKIPRILKNIRSFGDVRRHAVMARVFLGLKLKRRKNRKA